MIDYAAHDATYPRMIAAVVATMAVSLASLMAFVVGLVGASPISAASTMYTINDLGTLPNAKCPDSSANGITVSG